MGLQMLYVPVPDAQTGEALAEEAVTKKLAACGNLHGPIQSFYEWEGAFCKEQEWVLILKTTAEKAEACSQMVEEAHPYDCPCVTRLPVTANAAFAKWVTDSVS